MCLVILSFSAHGDLPTWALAILSFMKSFASSSKPELLAPAGGPEPFAAALAAGADAIYCGMGSFNARRKAANFTGESFAEACRAAHLAGARVYVTVNVVIKEHEMPQALELVERCWRLGADAFIVQDWGLFFALSRLMPQVELHVSTQANIHDARGTAWCEAAGAARVTLSRELSVAEIAAIHAAVPGVELEVFSHGAICFCYSGVCMLSAFAMAGRSANRGMCAQPCRLPYELIDEAGQRLSPEGRDRALCPRDTNTSQMVDRLLAAGASALKLEGRMKAPDYVYSIVDAYRHYLDAAELGVRVSPAEDERLQRQLKRCFNRDFTHAYQDGRSGNEMMSYERSNNRGQIVGEVLGSRPAGIDTRGMARDDKRRKLAIVRMRLSEPVGKGDLLELRHDDEFDQFLTTIAQADAAAGDVIECRIPRAMPAGALVRVIRSQAAIDAAGAALKRDVLRRRKVNVHITARLGEPFAVKLSCCDAPELRAEASGFSVEPARTKAVTREDLVEHVGRMGSSPFEAADFSVELDEGCGMGFSAVHKLRAEACRKLEQAILAEYEARANEPRAFDAARAKAAEQVVCAAPVLAPELCATAATLEAAAAAREAGAARVYMTNNALVEAGLSPKEAAAQGIVPILDEVCREADRERLDAWAQPGQAVAVGNISELALAAQRGASAEIRSCIPVHNSACAQALAAAGAKAIWLSPEISLAEIQELALAILAGTSEGEARPLRLGITVFGRPRVMTSEHCILQVTGQCVHDCARCRLRAQKLMLKNIDGKKLPVRTDLHGRSRLFDAYAIDITPQVPELLQAGVSRFHVDGTLMGVEELRQAVRRAAKALDAAAQGKKPAKRQQGTTTGCLFVGVS